MFNVGNKIATRESLTAPPELRLLQNTIQHEPKTGEQPDCTHLAGKRVGLIVFSAYPFDARPRRTADALVRCGMDVDYVCIAEGRDRLYERIDGLNVIRVPIEHRRGGKLSYLYEYSAFIIATALILAARSLTRRYDLVYVNNMPDILVASALLPKLCGAKVILDSHDPMPELMTTIFAKDPESLAVRGIARLEKWSISHVHRVFTPNTACQRLLSRRSCGREKIEVVMNTPDEGIFGFRPVVSTTATVSARPFIAMYHGTLEKRNGIDLAIEAFSRLRSEIPSAELHVYGKITPFLEGVMQSARQRGCDENVFLFGQKTLEQIVIAIDGCDVGIIPNRNNAFTNINTPVRIFEYLARGKPVIAPRTAGIQDYFTEDSLAFFEAGNAEDLGHKMQLIASHPEYALEIAERGQRIYQAHTWQRERTNLLNAVNEMLKAHPKEAPQWSAM